MFKWGQIQHNIDLVQVLSTSGIRTQDHVGGGIFTYAPLSILATTLHVS